MKRRFKKVVILDHEPFSTRKKLHYFIESFLSERIIVEYWCLSNILPYSQDIEYNYGSSENYVRNFDNYEDFIKNLKSLDPNECVLVVECWYELSTIDIFRIIKAKSFFWLKIDYYCNPTTFLNPRLTVLEKLWNYRKNLFFKLYNYVLIKWLNKGQLSTPSILFLTGANRENCPVGNNIISLNYFDIEDYNNKRLDPPILDYKYNVFLDIMLVDHPDSQRNGYKEVLSKEKYFSLLNRFFDYLEKKTGLPVVIASHPKANYNDEFGIDRLCIKNKTAELCINAEMILTHGSLSISYALLAEKPLVYIYSGELFKDHEELELLMYRMEKASKMLATPMVNFDRLEYTFERIAVEKERYESFLDLLYRSLSPSKANNFDIVFQGIRKYFEN